MQAVHVPSSGLSPVPRPLRVLVVEDEANARTALHEALTSLGYDCEVANDGAQALEAHRARPVDLILSDWAMPRLDGLALCCAIREHDGARRYTYFILMTAHADKSHLVEAMRAGTDDYLAKPIDLDELEARLIAASRVVRLHRRLSDSNRSLRRDSQRFFRAARMDALTNVANRLQLDEDLPRLCARVREGRKACIAICDIDHFKMYNDTFGHLAGDDVLRRVAATIQRSVRSSDSVYRYGGEEFLIMLPDQTLEEARVAMERVRSNVASLDVPSPTSEGRITLSAGLAAAHGGDGIDAQAWLERADRALYRAKSHGRNRCESSA